MTIKIFTSQKQISQAQKLLVKDIPSYRQAYSDRTAWVMACLSELAYIRFNPIFRNNAQKDYFVRELSKIIDKGRKSRLHKLIDLAAYDHIKEKENLIQELKTLNLDIVETFDSKGTQAILVSNGKFLCLAFRGTEATSIKDIKADAKAKTKTCDSCGKIHTGFSDAYDAVRQDIQSILNKPEHANLPLFIAGHSLGGALATIATKKLQTKIAACYTFGSPRVGDDAWVCNVKPPIYRVVNAADCVTMLPPGDEIISSVSWIVKLIALFPIPYIAPALKKFANWLPSKFGGYIHCGDMRYLTNCKSGGDYANVQILPAVSFWRRIKGWWKKKAPWKGFLADHSISVYRKKLMVIAERRNP